MVLDLGVHGVAGVAAGLGDDAVGAVHVELGEGLEGDGLYHNADGGGEAVYAVSDAARDEGVDGEVADFVEVSLVALDALFAERGHLVGGEARVNPHVLEGPVEAVNVAVEDEGLAREGAGYVEDDVGDDEAPVFGGDSDVAEREPLAVEVRAEGVLVNHVMPPCAGVGVGSVSIVMGRGAMGNAGGDQGLFTKSGIRSAWRVDLGHGVGAQFALWDFAR